MGLQISSTVAGHVIQSGKAWENEGINYLLGSAVLAMCFFGIYLRRFYRVIYGLVELAVSVVLIGASSAMAWGSFWAATPKTPETQLGIVALIPWITKLNFLLPVAASL